MARTASKIDQIGIDEFAARRDRVLKQLKGSAAVVFAGDGSPPLTGRWQAHHHFVYLTGMENESGAAVLFDPANEDPRKRIVLFLRPLNIELEKWDGYRQQIGPELKDSTEIYDDHAGVGVAVDADGRRPVAARQLACLHPFSRRTRRRCLWIWQPFSRSPSACRA